MGWGGNWQESACFGIPQDLGPLGGNSVGWDWAGKIPAEKVLRTGNTGLCCT